MPDNDDILLLIPQREPFVMTDRLLKSDDAGCVSEFEVRADNIFLEDGYLTAPGIMENIAQTAAARAGFMAHQAGVPVQLGYIGAVKNLEIITLPLLGEKLTTEITVVNQIFDVTVVHGKVWSADTLLAQCEMKIFISPNT